MREFRAAAIALLISTASAAQGAPAERARAAEAAQPAPFADRFQAAKAAMMADPAEALGHARAIVALSRTLRDEGERSDTLLQARWLEGEALTRLNRPQEARPIIEEALREAVRTQPGSKLHGDLLKSRAAVSAVMGDVQAALNSLHQAHAIFGRLGEARSQAIVLQNIGSIYSDARDYPRVLRYYEQANETFKDDPALSMAAHNNRGNALKEMGRLAEAEAEYRQALATAKALESPLLEARILTNIASAQFLRGNLSGADATAAAGLRIASGSAQDWRPFLWGVRAQVARARGDISGAERLLARTFEGANLAKTTMFYRDFHETARHVYSALGDHKLALAHLAAFKRLDDEARDLAASTNSALLSARFDAANQELRIGRLKAERMRDELTLRASQERVRSLSLMALVGALAAAAIIAAILFALRATRRSRDQVRAANESLTFAAQHDGLTRLVNRAHFRTLLGERIEAKSPCSLLLIDLDRFKTINDTLGHVVGDKLLCAVAGRLLEAAGEGAVVGRLGGDEFAVILPKKGGRSTLGKRADSIIEQLSAPFTIDGASVSVGATVGIAIAGQDGSTVDCLTRSADLALYRAKAAGRGRHDFFASWMQEEADDRRLLEIDLQAALAEDRLSISYQPIVEAERGKVVAFEALLRWEHPTRGVIPPSLFVPIAEEARLINEIGAWVLRSACAEAATWPEDVKVAVNLSALQVEGEGLAAIIMGALASSGLAPGRLELEVTESVFLRQGVRTEATLDRLRAIGVSLALDDFGTGYSSLGYLQRASFSKIKIDRSFVQAAATGCHEAIAIIQAIVALARGLNMDTTAEGVESEAERAMMQQLGCSQLQGYLFGAPTTKRSTRRAMIESTEALRAKAA